MPKVDADAPKEKDIPTEDKAKTKDSLEETADNDKVSSKCSEPALAKSKREQKEKMGFRERKVIVLLILLGRTALKKTIFFFNYNKL